MLSQIFCYWDKQQSAVSNMTQFHLTLKCTKDQSFHFCDCVLVSKWIFQHHDRGLTKLHAGSDQLLVCVVINNPSFPTVKNNNTAYHAFGKYWMQARGLLNYRLKYRWPKVVYCICEPNELERKIKGKNWGECRGPSKNLGAWPTQAPLRIATGFTRNVDVLCFVIFTTLSHCRSQFSHKEGRLSCYLLVTSAGGEIPSAVQSFLSFHMQVRFCSQIRWTEDASLTRNRFPRKAICSQIRLRHSCAVAQLEVW